MQYGSRYITGSFSYGANEALCMIFIADVQTGWQWINLCLGLLVKYTTLGMEWNEISLNIFVEFAPDK